MTGEPKPGSSATSLAAVHNQVDVRAEWAGQRGATATAGLTYLMTNNPKQTQWRKLPRSVAGKSRAEVMEKAERLAAQLKGLDIHQLAPAIREIREQDQAVRRFVA